MFQFYLVKASKYYGSHATGWVALVNNEPHHAATKKEAVEFLGNFQKRNEDVNTN